MLYVTLLWLGEVEPLGRRGLGAHDGLRPHQAGERLVGEGSPRCLQWSESCRRGLFQLIRYAKDVRISSGILLLLLSQAPQQLRILIAFWHRV